MKTTFFLSIGALLLGGAVLCAGQAGRDKYETPGYQIAKSDGAFEVRDYPAITIVSAPMAAADGNRNNAFMSLFGYISGKNEAQQKISMTSPVITTTEGDTSTMSFIVPAEVAQAGAPAATDPAIAVSERSAGRFAVYRYSGRWTAEREAAARDKLSAWLGQQGLETLGDFEKANYDPPFTLPALRRNEVMVRIKE